MKRFLLVLLFVPFLLSGCNFMEEDVTVGLSFHSEEDISVKIKYNETDFIEKNIQSRYPSYLYLEVLIPSKKFNKEIFLKSINDNEYEKKYNFKLVEFNEYCFGLYFYSLNDPLIPSFSN